MNHSVKIIFTGSLVINFLLVGFVIGHFALPKPKGARPDPYAITRDLSEPLAGEVGQMITTALEERRADHAQLGEAQERVMAILTAPEFNAQTFTHTLGELDALHKAHHQRMTALMAAIASKLSQPERMKLAEHLRQSAPPVD
ncbi:MAG: periplasmic heavy metal sensor [Alphaproteobacteria bacterium]|jgi:uncharacterized membrane protein